MKKNYICELNENVERKHVSYKNRYGMKIAGDIYYSKNIDLSKKHAALIVGAPYGE